MKNFSYTGAAQTFTAPYTGYYKVELWGARGVDDRCNGCSAAMQADPTAWGLGGYGGYVSGVINKTSKNTNLYVYIGSSGVGYNGGGTGGSGEGGGASDMRTINGSWDGASSLRSRIIVAGGGGGGEDHGGNGGAGGGLSGYAGHCNINAGYSSDCSTVTTGNYSVIAVNGGTQTSGDVFGRAYNSSELPGWGRGGGGWYGGNSSKNPYGGGGGSSYISGHTGSVAVASTSSSSPKSGCTTGTTNNACSISPYGYTFTNTVMIDGAGYKWTNVKGALQQMPNPSGGYYASGVGHSGNGHARVTWLGTSI